jgi:biotin-dependent carboxylase-like uncharacterized protein
MRVMNGGIQTFVEDWPGRPCYAMKGISPAGAVDTYSLRAANVLVGNHAGEAALEIRAGFFEAEFTEDTVIAVTGADMAPTVNGGLVPLWESIKVSKGDKIKFGPLQGGGFVSYLGIAGGINVPIFLGSKSTCTNGSYGGFQGRKLEGGDHLEFGKPEKRLRELEGRKFKKPLIPEYSKIWKVRAIPGPQTAPDYFTEEGMEMWYSQPWRVDHNINRGALRLRHPKPIFARTTGGMGGVHPANLILQPYACPGALNVCGDYGILLFVDGVSIGGYVCALTVIVADHWKLGQVKPVVDSIKFDYCKFEEAREALIKQDDIFTEAALQ